MALIVRSTKAGSTTQFATSFSLGNTLAIADLDTDLNTIVAAINGNIDQSNLALEAVITSKIAALAVTSTKIGSSAVTNTKIAPDAVDKTKILAGATVQSFVSAGPTASLNITTGLTTMVTLPAITTRGGVVILGGILGLNLSNGVVTGGRAVVKILRNAGEIFSIGYTSTSPDLVISPLPTPLVIDQPAAGSHVYTVTGQTTNANLAIQSDTTSLGLFYAIELS